jgi:hypothetical protein
VQAHARAVEDGPLPPQAPPYRVLGQVDGGVRVNPVGVAIQGSLYYRRVWRHDDALDFDSQYLQLGAVAQLNPAYVQPSAYVELVPLPFLVLRAEYALQLYMGMNKSLLRFEAKDARFDDGVLEAREGDERTGIAQRAQAELVLRAALGRWLASVDNQLYYYAFDDQGPFLYESEFDTLLEPSGLLYNGRAQLAFDVSSAATPEITLVGLFYERTEAFDADLRRQRVGGFAYYEPPRGWLGFAASRLYAQLGLNLEDRNREHGMFAALGVGFDLAH